MKKDIRYYWEYLNLIGATGFLTVCMFPFFLIAPDRVTGVSRDFFRDGKDHLKARCRGRAIMRDLDQ